MFWIAIIAVLFIAAVMDSPLGKVVMGAAVVAIGLLLLSLITGAELFVTLSKVCAVIIVGVIVWIILLAIIGE